MTTKSWRQLGKSTGALTTLLACALVFAVSGCSTKAPKYDWSNPDAAAGDLEKARAECIKQAEDATAQTRQDWPAVHSMINVFLGCMKEKGWELDEEDDDGD